MTGTYILLEEHSLASKHFQLLDKDKQELFMRFPIVNLWTQGAEPLPAEKSNPSPRR
jgi:hypothetical protein